MLIALALAALIAPAGELSDPDGVVTTAPRGDGAVIVGAEAPTTDARPDAAQTTTAIIRHPLTTQQQIDRWISDRTTESRPFAENTGPQDDRKMHGFVSGAIGTNDYSSVSVGVSLPVGESGRIDLAFSQTKNGYGYPGYGYGYPGEYGYGGLGYGSRVRPYGGYDSFYGEPGRSRSMSLGFRWDERDDRDERGPMRSRGITAED